MALTKDEMTKSVMQALEDSVQHIPEEKREEVKARILGAWSGQMFSMGMREKEK
jgi:alpha-acetolactate decarboxylase